MRDQMIDHKINKKLKHVSAIRYMSTPWGSLISEIFSCQNLPAIEEQLKKGNPGFRSDFVFKARAAPVSEAEISNEYIHMEYHPL
jgi:hypothetical protein